jgi:ATP-dependent protease HslVU (ClpYQ) peptidase subunit
VRVWPPDEVFQVSGMPEERYQCIVEQALSAFAGRLMTCIVGIATPQGVFIGGDSAGTRDAGEVLIRKDAKVFKRQGWVFGYSGSYRLGQILQYEMAGCAFFQSSEDTHASLVLSFVPELQKTLADLHLEPGAKKPWTIMCGVDVDGPRLFVIHHDFSVAEYQDGYTAIGSGAPFALGAMRYAEQHGASGSERMLRGALDAATYFSPHVRYPFVIESIEA